MNLSLMGRPSGAPPPNTLKKIPSTTARKLSSSDPKQHYEQQHQHYHQPWATGHLLPRINDHHTAIALEEIPAFENNHPSQTTQNATMPASKNKTSTTSSLHPNESTDKITPLPPPTTHHSVSANTTSHTNPSHPYSSTYTTSPTKGHSNVSLPTRTPRKHAYSECFDLEDISSSTSDTFGNNSDSAPTSSQNTIRSPSGSLLSGIRSPSGHMLTAQQAAGRSDRPRGVRERQEAIRRRLREERGRVEGEEREREAREREEEMVMRNRVRVVGGVKRGEAEVEVKAKGKGNWKGKFPSLCGCL